MIGKLIPRLLNKELDETLVKPTEFVDAINVKVDGVSGTDSGIIKYANGNEIISFNDESNTSQISVSQERIVGVCEDDKDDTIYVFASGSSYDSIYMVSYVGGDYKMTLLVRSPDLELNDDNFVASDVIRVYNTKIDTSGSDGGTGGTFDDSVDITDFGEGEVIDTSSTDDAAGLANILVTENINVPEDILLVYGDQAVLPDSVITVKNVGDANATIQISASLTGTNPLSTYSSQLNGIGGSFNPSNFVLAPGAQRVVSISTYALGVEVGDKITLTASIDSDAVGFETLEYSSQGTVYEETIYDPEYSFTPNATLDVGDFLPVEEGFASYQQKALAITHTVTQGASPPISGTASIITSSPDVAAATYFSYTIETAPPEVVISETIDFTINPGETFEWFIALQLNGTEPAFYSAFQIRIEFDPDIEYGTDQLPTVTSPAIYCQVEEFQTSVDPFPVFAYNNIGGWGGSVVETEPLSTVPSAGAPGTSTGIDYYYMFSEIGGQSGGDVNVVCSFEWETEGFSFGDPAALFTYGYEEGSTGNPDSITFLSPAPIYSIPVGALQSSRFYFNLDYTVNGLGENSEFESLVNEFGNDVQLKVTIISSYQGQNGPIPVGTDTARVTFTPLQANGTLSFAVTTSSTQIIGTGSPNGINSWSGKLKNYPTSTGGQTSGLNGLIVISATNNGANTNGLPIVSITNSRVVSEAGQEGSYISSIIGSSYLTQTLFNADWVNNRILWTGVGSFYFVPTQPASVGYMLSGISNISNFGWQPLYLAEGWDEEMTSQSIFDSIVGWESINPNTSSGYYQSSQTEDLIFSQIDPIGMTDSMTSTDSPADYLSFKQYNMTSISSVAGLSLWFKATYTGGTNFSNIQPASELAGGETAYLVLAGWSPVNAKTFAGLKLQAPYPYQNSSATISIVLEADSLTFSLPAGGQSEGDKKYIPSDPVQETSTDSGNDTVISSSTEYPSKKTTTPVVSSLSSSSALKKAKIKTSK